MGLKTSLKKFQDDKFGMFIHFGLYSIPAGLWNGREPQRRGYAEWILYNAFGPDIPLKEYQNLTKEFNPLHFDADEWADAAKNAGMRYLIFTAKHHDGFALWDSKVSTFNAVRATPFGRDLVLELKNACEKRGLQFGVYYSHWQDWEHPCGGLPHWQEISPRDNRQFDQYWREKCLPQVNELLDYGIRLFWFDNWCRTPNLRHENLKELIDLVHHYDPECLVNSRIGVTWNAPELLDAVDYISMGDNEFPKEKIARPWETSGTFNHSWGYSCCDYSWKSTAYLLQCLIRNVGRNGNYQLNVGPRADGSFPPPCIRRLREIGAWIGPHAEALYGTHPMKQPFEPDFGCLTESPDGKNCYAFILNNSNDIPYYFFTDRPCRSATVLETGQKVDYEQDGNGIGFKMPRETAFSIYPVMKFEFA